jgi:TATA-binding protein-associated factor Taf7
VYLATLLDMPCIMEAQKTLDYRTFFKSVDVSQMLYVHNKWMDDFKTRTADEVIEWARSFNPLAKKELDPDFYNNLYRRTELQKRVSELQTQGGLSEPSAVTVGEEWYKYRHGLAPSSKNVRNIRYKKE